MVGGKESLKTLWGPVAVQDILGSSGERYKLSRWLEESPRGQLEQGGGVKQQRMGPEKEMRRGEMKTGGFISRSWTVKEK